MCLDKIYILGNKNFIDNEKEFQKERVVPNPQGLYLLGTVPGDGYISSVRALGLLPVGNFKRIKRSGNLFLYIIGNCIVNQACNITSLELKLDKSTENVSNDSVQSISYEEEKRIAKNDLIAVYIPEQRKKHKAPYPLQVLISGSQTKSHCKLVRGSDTFKYKGMRFFEKIQADVEREGREKWAQEVDDVEGELNVEVKMILRTYASV